MGWWSSIHDWKTRRLFDAVGERCRFPGAHREVKGHVEVGNDCVLRGNLVLRTHKNGRIIFRDGVEIADYAMFQSNELIEIGAGSFIGPYCVLRDMLHLFQGTEQHWRLTPHIARPIHVGRNCYIAARCYIMPGISIGDGAVIAPGSIVTKDVGPLEIWAGSPARFVVHRTETANKTSLRRQLDLVSMFGVAQAGAED